MCFYYQCSEFANFLPNCFSLIFVALIFFNLKISVSLLIYLLHFLKVYCVQTSKCPSRIFMFCSLPPLAVPLQLSMHYTDLLQRWDEAVQAVDAQDWTGALAKLDQISEPTSRTLFTAASAHLALGQLEPALRVSVCVTVNRDFTYWSLNT